jgi:hypothetical protein
MKWNFIYVNNFLLKNNSMCILRHLPRQKNPRALCRGSSPILYVPMFPWKYFFSTKWERSQEIKKKVVYVKERFMYS